MMSAKGMHIKYTVDWLQWIIIFLHLTSNCHLDLRSGRDDHECGTVKETSVIDLYNVSLNYVPLLQKDCFRVRSFVRSLQYRQHVWKKYEFLARVWQICINISQVSMVKFSCHHLNLLLVPVNFPQSLDILAITI